MIIEGKEFPDSIMTQLIGEQTLTIDYLRQSLRACEAINAELAQQMLDLEKELLGLKALRLVDNNG